jgi:hypothetical protein
MAKVKTHFDQIPVKVVKTIAAPPAPRPK